MALILLSLSGCGNAGPVPDSFCVVAEPIYLSPEDKLSDRTLRKVLAQNEKGASLCGWK
jgi:predicted small lipoprotein YifL